MERGAGSGVLKLRNWWDFIDDYVIVGARVNFYPRCRIALGHRCSGRRQHGAEEYAGPGGGVRASRHRSVAHSHDRLHHPTIENVRQGVGFIQEHVEQGEVVYIHCKADRARSRPITICWLIQHRQMTPTEAQALLLSKRPHVNPRLTEQRPSSASSFVACKPSHRSEKRERMTKAIESTSQRAIRFFRSSLHHLRRRHLRANSRAQLWGPRQRGGTAR